MADRLPRPAPKLRGAQHLAPAVRKHPFLYFGLPLIGILVGGSFALAHLTQTKVDYNSTKVQQVSRDEALAMDGKRKKNFDVREEYFRLQAGSAAEALDDWDMVPVQKPPDTYVPPSPGEMEELLIKASTKVDDGKKKEPKIVRW
ncbi:hypothetical protein GGF32_004102 [Allomyces javanicus]|nr:hypothetical protein GGF32_004102 [Allomyces javanicus]